MRSKKIKNILKTAKELQFKNEKNVNNEMNDIRGRKARYRNKRICKIELSQNKNSTIVNPIK